VRQKVPEKGQGLPFPFVILDIHLVVHLVSLAATPDMQQKNGLGKKIGLVWLGRRWREAQDKFEVD